MSGIVVWASDNMKEKKQIPHRMLAAFVRNDKWGDVEVPVVEQ